MNTFAKHIIFPVLIVFALAAGCDSALNIEPEDVLVEDDVFADENLSERALGQAYSSFADAATGDAYMIGDYTTDIAHTSEFRAIFSNGEVDPEDSIVETIWRDYYRTINLANSLIVKIPNQGTYDETLMSRHVAEARFIRAYCYFNLLILYGQGALTGNTDGMGLPLRLQPYDGYEQGANIPRSSTEEVYDQVLRDLKTGSGDLPVEHDSHVDTRSRATKGTAHALLSRVYLYRAEYDSAAYYAQQVLDEVGLYTLEPTVLDLFPPHSDINVTIEMSQEHIFGFPFGYNQLGGNNLGFTYYFKHEAWANEDFADQYDAGDERQTELIFRGWDEPDTPAENRQRRTTFKFNNSNGRDNVSMLRLAEIMLIRAEALARLSGVNQESVNLLSDVYTRANPSATDFTTGDFSNQQELVDRILLERKFELAFEGLYRYDRIRTGQPLGQPPLSDNKLILPIPQVDISISDGIVEQNPGY